MTTSTDSIPQVVELLESLARTRPQRPSPAPRAHRARPAAGGGGWVVPPSGASLPRGTALGRTLQRRRSRRDFAAADLELATVLDVIGTGHEADVEDNPGEEPLEWTVAALRTSSHRGALLAAEPATRTVRLAAVLAADRFEELTLQQEFARAGAVISVGGDLQEAERRHGPHGYRLLMGRAASAAYLAWLSAVELGLVGSVFAGFLPAAVRRPLASDGVLRQQLVAVAIGPAPHPAG